MNRGEAETPLMVASAALWLGVVGLGGTGHWLTALYALLALVAVYCVLGSVQHGRSNLGLVMVPSLLWLASWAASFLIANRYAEIYRGRVPARSVFGFHPSFTAIIVLYWLVPTVIMGLGFEAVKDRWLPQERWAAFVRSVQGDDEISRAGEEERDHD